MSMAGFKKQLNKANQFMSEKLGGAKGTPIDASFVKMEHKVDILERLVEDLTMRVHELLQPNPASRARLKAARSVAKLGISKASQALYPQPEGLMAECMIKHGSALGEESLYGQALVECGETYRQLAEIKYAIEDSIKQNFLEPLYHLQTKDIKEVNHHRKKMLGRRLDYDCKRRKQAKGAQITPEEIGRAEGKFIESKDLAEMAMMNLLENDTEQITQLSSFIEASQNYHQTSLDLLQNLHSSLDAKCQHAINRPRQTHSLTQVWSIENAKAPSEYDIPDYNENDEPPSYAGIAQPCAKALYDFEPEEDEELAFNEGDIIYLIGRMDANWLEGTINGQTGHFPVNYVEVVVPLPNCSTNL